MLCGHLLQVIMYVVAIVIWVKNHQCQSCREPTWLIVAYNTVLFLVNILVAAAAWFAVKYPDKLKWCARVLLRHTYICFPVEAFGVIGSCHSLCFHVSWSGLPARTTDSRCS